MSITNVLQCDNKSAFMRELKHTAHKFYYNFKSYKIFSSVIKPRDISILKAFSKNSNIMVCKPDKGRGVVVVDKVNYLESMNSIISDNLRFSEIIEPIEKFSLKIEDKINNFLRKLKDIDFSLKIY